VTTVPSSQSTRLVSLSVAQRMCVALCALSTFCGLASASLLPMPPAAEQVRLSDVPDDAGGALLLEWTTPSPEASAGVVIERSANESERAKDPNATWVEVERIGKLAVLAKEGSYTLKGLSNSEDTRVRVAVLGVDGELAEFVESEPARPVVSLFAWKRVPLLLVVGFVSLAVLVWVLLARRGVSTRIRRIAALDAVDEAVGRATEMGRAVLFVPGIQDMNDIQTIAGLTVLGRVARTAAEYDARLEVPTCRSIVMTAARETVQSAHQAVGRPETYSEGAINYITDEQFGYVAYLAGHMTREKPAACFYMGAFYAESLVLAENGNSIGAIQIAGTAEPSQLPFFVAACDYTLIGEEFFAASAYLSGERDQLGSIKGQDVGKLLALAAIATGCACATAAAVLPAGSVSDMAGAIFGVTRSFFEGSLGGSGGG
jgi:hypothetical protein